MELSFILLILGFILVTYLIFKFIKKIIFAVISFIFLIFLIIGSVFGLVYLDLNNLASQSDFNVNLVYGDSEAPVFGLVLPIEDKSLNQDNIKSLDISSLDTIDYSESEDFYVYMSKDLFSSLLSSEDKYYLIGTEDLEVMGVKIETALTKKQVISILNSNNDLDDYVEIIYSENDLPEILAENGKIAIKELIKVELKKKNLDFNQALLGSILINLGNDSSNIVKLISGFKDESLEVYPDRFTFKLARMLPVDFILGYVPEDLISS